MPTSPVDFIIDLMRHDYERVGFLPKGAIEQYIASQNYILASERGKPVGYLLHGPLRANGLIVIHQHCISPDKRLRNYGTQAFKELVTRAQSVGASAIRLRCGQEMIEANAFWQAMGFRCISTQPGGNRRKRTLNNYWLNLDPNLFEESDI